MLAVLLVVLPPALLVLRWLGRPQELFIGGARVNAEECRLRRLQLDLDRDPQTAQCFDNVRRRMTEGASGQPETWLTSKRLRPIYQPPALPKKQRRPRRNKNVVAMPARKQG